MIHTYINSIIQPSSQEHDILLPKFVNLPLPIIVPYPDLPLLPPLDRPLLIPLFPLNLNPPPLNTLNVQPLLQTIDPELDDF